jgi:hypothetical protein
MSVLEAEVCRVGGRAAKKPYEKRGDDEKKIVLGLAHG